MKSKHFDGAENFISGRSDSLTTILGRDTSIRDWPHLWQMAARGDTSQHFRPSHVGVAASACCDILVFLNKSERWNVHRCDLLI